MNFTLLYKNLYPITFIKTTNFNSRNCYSKSPPQQSSRKSWGSSKKIQACSLGKSANNSSHKESANHTAYLPSAPSTESFETVEFGPRHLANNLRPQLDHTYKTMAIQYGQQASNSQLDTLDTPQNNQIQQMLKMYKLKISQRRKILILLKNFWRNQIRRNLL